MRPDEVRFFFYCYLHSTLTLSGCEASESLLLIGAAI